MISSFAVSIGLLVLRRMGVAIPTHYALMITIAFTTATWLLTAFLAKPTDRKTLVDFYRKTRPFGPGWKAVRAEAGISGTEARGTHENFPLALVGWTSGVAVIWSSLFTVGNVLYGRWNYAGILFAVFVVSGLILIKVVNTLWENGKAAAPGR
jgi:hypothetical protein